MLMIRFGRWSYCKAKWFSYRRLYFKGFKWTPFVKMRLMSWGENQYRKEYMKKSPEGLKSIDRLYLE